MTIIPESEIHLYAYLIQQKIFSNDWDTKRVANHPDIQGILNSASKKGSGNRGEPDLIYVNRNKKLLILLENKSSITSHKSIDGRSKPVDFAVDGIRHYLSFFVGTELNENNKHLSDWKIIGIAFSGDIRDEYNKLIDSFIIKNGVIENINVREFLDENDYLRIFENIDLEHITTNISSSSREINIKLREIDAENRPILLSASMISLLDRHDNDFRENFKNYKAETLVKRIPEVVEYILDKEGIDSKKVNLFIRKLVFLQDSIDLKNDKLKILYNILTELKDNVIPLFEKKSSYDIIGKFYEEFLKYAGIANVKKGIVLTPYHITTLFTDLLDEEIKNNDVFLDPCCGTGAFLISGMNKIINKIETSNISNKFDRVNMVKEYQIIGIEKNATMFSLAISNMLFRGDGKSRILNGDFFDDIMLEEVKQLNPTIGFINPPYSGLDNAKNPTKKEIQFLERMLDTVNRFGIIIAPLSTFFKDTIIRNRILSKHMLKYVINMPSDLFQPNAMTHTAIAVFETHQPHNNNRVIFYDLKDDGFMLSKNKGRTDKLNKWQEIRKKLLNDIKDTDTNQDNIKILKKKISNNDEWVIQAHSETDYSDMDNQNFENTIKEYVIFKTKVSLDLLNKNMRDIDLFNLFSKSDISNAPKLGNFIDMDKKRFKWFSLEQFFEIKGSKSITQTDIDMSHQKGSFPYVTTSAQNNGIQGFYEYFTEQGKVLTVDSATIGSCFYQELNFSASDHVEKLVPNFNINIYIAMFLITIMKQEKYRYGYGRKFSQKRLKNTKIKLPVNMNSDPDWDFMENYIKSLPYSSNL